MLAELAVHFLDQPINIYKAASDMYADTKPIVRAIEDFGKRSKGRGPLAHPPAEPPIVENFPPEFTPPTKVNECYRFQTGKRQNWQQPPFELGKKTFEPGWSGELVWTGDRWVLKESFGWRCSEHEPEFRGQQVRIDDRFEVIYLRPSEDGFALVQGPSYISKVGYEAITSITAPPFTPPNWNR